MLTQAQPTDRSSEHKLFATALECAHKSLELCVAARLLYVTWTSVVAERNFRAKPTAEYCGQDQDVRFTSRCCILLAN